MVAASEATSLGQGPPPMAVSQPLCSPPRPSPHHPLRHPRETGVGVAAVNPKVAPIHLPLSRTSAACPQPSNRARLSCLRQIARQRLGPSRSHITVLVLLRCIPSCVCNLAGCGGAPHPNPQTYLQTGKSIKVAVLLGRRSFKLMANFQRLEGLVYHLVCSIMSI